MSIPASRSAELPVVVTSLLRGVVYQEANETLWRDLLAVAPQARDVVALMGLQVIVDEGEGYAYLRSQPESERDPRIPRLIPRRELSFEVSLLLALLRGRLARFDAQGGETRLVLRRDDIIELLRVFLDESNSSPARMVDRTDALIRRVVDLGFLRPVRLGSDDEGRLPGETGQDDAGCEAYEVRRILKAFVDAQWLSDFDARLADYQRLARSHASSADPNAGSSSVADPHASPADPSAGSSPVADPNAEEH